MTDIEINEFEIAAKVKKELAAVPKDAAVRILRWVTESYGVMSPPPASGHAPYQQPANSPHAPTPHAPHRSKDVRTFVEEKQPKSDLQYAAVVAYYYRFEAPDAQRSEIIDAKLLEDSTRHANWKRLAAPRTTLNNAVKQGYLDNIERGKFRINSVGENLVAMTLPGGGDGFTAASRSRKVGKKKKKTKKKAKKPSRKRG